MSSTTFSNHFMGGYRNSDCRTSTWNFNIYWYTLTVFVVKNFNTCFTALNHTISAASTHLSRQNSLFIPKKEEIFLWPRTYLQ